MKPLITFLLIAFSYVISVAQQKVIKDPVEYNDFIVNLQMEIYNEMIEFNLLIEKGTPREDVDKRLDKAVAKTDDIIARLVDLVTLNPEFSIKQNAIELFRFYRKTMNEGYKQMVALIYTEAPDMDKINSIVKLITDEEAKFDAAFQEAQQNFAKHYNIQLAEPAKN